MEVIEAMYRVVTPMFCSGADQSKAELRLPSIKGALRFWWRALAWGRLNGDLAAIRQQENELFGSTDTGQAGVLMRLKGTSDVSVATQNAGDWRINDWQSYVGYGLVDKKTRPTREFIQQDQSFVLQLSSKEKQTLQNLIPTLKAFGLLGGLGGRARKGWGSVNLQSISGIHVWSSPINREQYESELDAIESDYQNSPNYSAFWQGVDIEFGEIQRTAEAAQKYLAVIYKEAVRDGFNKAEREQFGLPRRSNNQRRASPVHLHVQYLSANEYLPVAAFFSAQFLDNQPQAKGNRSKVDVFLNAIVNGGLE